MTATDRLPDLFDDVQAAKVAARLTDRVGDTAVRRHRTKRPIRPPAPGIAVLGCRCGRVLSAGQLHRRPRTHQDGEAAAVERIVCAACAHPAQPIGDPQ